MQYPDPSIVQIPMKPIDPEHLPEPEHFPEPRRPEPNTGPFYCQCEGQNINSKIVSCPGCDTMSGASPIVKESILGRIKNRNPEYPGQCFRTKRAGENFPYDGELCERCYYRLRSEAKDGLPKPTILTYLRGTKGTRGALKRRKRKRTKKKKKTKKKKTKRK
jgi:hypothetical protein